MGTLWLTVWQYRDHNRTVFLSSSFDGSDAFWSTHGSLALHLTQLKPRNIPEIVKIASAYLASYNDAFMNKIFKSTSDLNTLTTLKSVFSSYISTPWFSLWCATQIQAELTNTDPWRNWTRWPQIEFLSITFSCSVGRLMSRKTTLRWYSVFSVFKKPSKISTTWSGVKEPTIKMKGDVLPLLTCPSPSVKRFLLRICTLRVLVKETTLPLRFLNVSDTSVTKPGRTDNAMTINNIMTMRLACVFGVMSIETEWQDVNNEAF